MDKQPGLLDKQSKSVRGFTLIEVLIALVIVSIALFAIMRASLSSIGNFATVRTLSEASWVASDALTRVINHLPVPGQGDSVGEIREQKLGQTWLVIVGRQHTPHGLQRYQVSVGLAPRTGQVTLVGYGR